MGLLIRFSIQNPAMPRRGVRHTFAAHILANHWTTAIVSGYFFTSENLAARSTWSPSLSPRMISRGVASWARYSFSSSARRFAEPASLLACTDEFNALLALSLAFSADSIAVFDFSIAESASEIACCDFLLASLAFSSSDPLPVQIYGSFAQGIVAQMRETRLIAGLNIWRIGPFFL